MTYIHRLLRQVGHRGTSLLFFALVDLVYGVGLAFAPPETRATPTYQFLESMAPLSVWAASWLIVGGVCVVQAFMRQDRLAFALASALKVGWGVVALIGWLLDAVPRGYVSAAIFLAFAGFVQVIATWPEPRRLVLDGRE